MFVLLKLVSYEITENTFVESSNTSRMDKVKQNIQGFLKKPEMIRKSKHRKTDSLTPGAQPLHSKIGRRLAHGTSFRQSSSSSKSDEKIDAVIFYFLF